MFQFCTFRLFFMIRIFVMVNIYPGPRTHVATIFCTICLPSIKNCLSKDLCSFDGEKRRNWFVIEGNWYLYLIWKNRFFSVFNWISKKFSFKFYVMIFLWSVEWNDFVLFFSTLLKFWWNYIRILSDLFSSSRNYD